MAPVSFYGFCCMAIVISLTSLPSIRAENSTNTFDEHGATPRRQDLVTINMCCELNLESPPTSCGDGESKFPQNILTEPYDMATMNLTFPPFLEIPETEIAYYVRQSPPNCTNGYIVNDFYINANGTNDFRMLPDGVLKIGPQVYDSNYYRLDQYCVNALQKGRIQFRTCKPPCSPSEPCVQKCCPLDSVVTGKGVKWRCKKGLSKLTPSRATVDNSKNMTKEDIMRRAGYYYVHNPSTWPKACKSTIYDVFTEDLLGSHEVHPTIGSNGFGKRTYFVLDNGQVFYGRAGTKDWSAIDYSCIDGVADENELKNPNVTTKKMILFACKMSAAGDKNGSPSPVTHNFYGAFAVSCSVFALATVIFFAFLWEKQNVYGWMLMSFCVAIFGLFLCLGIAHLILDGQNSGKPEVGLVPSTSCGTIALICQFCFVASFSWLMVLSLELWFTFRSVVITGPRSNGLARYFCSSLMAWGIPLLTIILYLREAKENVSLANTNFYPTMVEHCVATSQTLWEFVYGPSLMMFVATVMCFLLTARSFNEYKRCTQSSVNEIPHNKMYTQFVKLLYVVIFVWIVEGITWALQATNTAPVSWHILLTINYLEPVAIFYIFALNPDTLKDLAEKLFTMNFSPAVWLLRIRRRSSGFQDSFGGDEDGFAINENAPLSSPRQAEYTEVARSDYLDADAVLRT